MIRNKWRELLKGEKKIFNKLLIFPTIFFQFFFCQDAANSCTARFFPIMQPSFFSPATKTEKKESFVRKRLVRKIFRFCHQEATFIPGKRKQCLRCDIFFLNRKKSKTLRSSAISKSVASNDCCEPIKCELGTIKQYLPHLEINKK